MWIKTSNGGRINLDQVTGLLISAGTVSTFNVDAHLASGISVEVAHGFGSELAAAAAIDDLLVNGS